MDSQKYLQLPSRLVTERRRKGLSQKQVAGRASLQQASLCAYEKGRKWPNPEHVTRIAVALGLTDEEAHGLHWAARHDGLLLRAGELGLQDASEIVSAALCAAHLLPTAAVGGAVHQLRSAVAAQSTLAQLYGAAVQQSSKEGVPMA